MELRHLRYFVAVAEELHFGRAAARLHIAQPPLSRQIRQLEAELGVALFDRDHRHVRLTDAGAVFLAQARATLAAAEQAAQAARRAARSEVGQLPVGFIGAASYSVLPRIVQAFRARYPDVELVLHEMTTAEQLQALREGQLRAGLVRPPVAHAALAAATVLREPLVVALPAAHPLAAEARVAVAALATEPWVLFPRPLAADLYDQILALCERAGFRPRLAQEALQMQTVVRLVGAGVGVSLVPRSVEALHSAGVAYRPLRDAVPNVEMAVAWRRDDTSVLLQRFLAVARAAAEVAG
ncbi:MAG TPA: LysR family transcriptional regulator [Chloroflexota bacterium]|nr:LysR family transcriptional regulator [Chloroflexota bacterium]